MKPVSTIYVDQLRPCVSHRRAKEKLTGPPLDRDRRGHNGDGAVVQARCSDASYSATQNQHSRRLGRSAKDRAQFKDGEE
jgi:hypothetical protein